MACLNPRCVRRMLFKNVFLSRPKRNSDMWASTQAVYTEAAYICIRGVWLDNWITLERTDCFALISSIAQILPYHSPVTVQLLLGKVSFHAGCNKNVSRIALISDSHKACLCHCSYKASLDLERHRCWVNPLSPCFTHPTALNQSQHAAGGLDCFPAT